MRNNDAFVKRKFEMNILHHCLKITGQKCQQSSLYRKVCSIFEYELAQLVTSALFHYNLLPHLLI